jgi:Rrf2 family protein
MLSQSVEYALRAMVHLVSVAPSPRTTEQLASAVQVPQAYLAKLMHRLVQTGVIRSQRGIGGGFSLALPPEEVTILMVVNAVAPIRRINLCPLPRQGHGVRLCPLHERLDRALALVEEVFATTTLADVLTEPGRNPPCRSETSWLVDLGTRTEGQQDLCMPGN